MQNRNVMFQAKWHKRDVIDAGFIREIKISEPGVRHERQAQKWTSEEKLRIELLGMQAAVEVPSPPALETGRPIRIASISDAATGPDVCAVKQQFRQLVELCPRQVSFAHVSYCGARSLTAGKWSATNLDRHDATGFQKPTCHRFPSIEHPSAVAFNSKRAL